MLYYLMSISVINIIYLMFMQKEGTIANVRGTACHASLYSYYFAEFSFFELKVTMLTVGGGMGCSKSPTWI